MAKKIVRTVKAKPAVAKSAKTAKITKTNPVAQTTSKVIAALASTKPARKAVEVVKPIANQVNTNVTKFVQTVNADNAQKVLFAGVGAAVRAQTEGEKLVGSMIKEARALELEGKKVVEARSKKARAFAKTQTTDVKSRVISTATAVKERAVELFEVRVAAPVTKQVTGQTQKVLGVLGVPTSQNIQELTVAVDTLRKNVESLQRRRAA
jgi:poly(hydroxyalkanoate) granule-associated protein